VGEGARGEGICGRGAAGVGYRRDAAVGAFGGGLRCAVACFWHACGLRGGLVQRGQVMAVGRGPGCSSSSPPCLTAGAWAGVTGGRQQGDREHCGKGMGTSEVSLHCLQTVHELLLNPAH
jgi:hypothetical protein